MARRLPAMICLLALVLFSGCAHRRPRLVTVARVGSTETGIASWYGPPYHGRRAANGEIYDMEQMTAAHRTLPFETWVRVENVQTRQSVEVRITDRGPFVHGRIIDLSRAAARDVGLLGPGVGRVKLKVVKAPRMAAAPRAGGFAVQVGAFADQARAAALRERLAGRYGTARIVQRAGNPVLWRVLVGQVDSPAEAETLAAELHTQTDATFVVRLDP